MGHVQPLPVRPIRERVIQLPQGSPFLPRLNRWIHQHKRFVANPMKARGDDSPFRLRHELVHKQRMREVGQCIIKPRGCVDLPHRLNVRCLQVANQIRTCALPSPTSVCPPFSAVPEPVPA